MSSAVTSIENTKKSFSKVGIFVVLVIVAGLMAVAIYIGYKEIQSNKNITKEAEVISNAEILNRVTMLTEVPYDEIPVIATVKDVEKLNNQVFFSRAQNGDKLLIYNKARRAILYRPYSNKIIETMTIKLTEQGEMKPEELVEGIITPLKISIYNGTSTPGLASALSTKLGIEFENIKFEVINIGNAKSEYEKTILVNNKNLEQELINKIASYIDAEVADLPIGEDPAETDIMIFIGKDYTN